MGKRLSDDEAAALGLPVTRKRRKLSADEVASLGLDQAQPAPPETEPLKVASDAPAPLPPEDLNEMPSGEKGGTFSKKESSAFGWGQGVTGRWLDEVQGKLGQGAEVVGRVLGVDSIRPKKTQAQQAVDEDLGEPGIAETGDRAYRNETERSRTNFKMSSQQNPKTHLGGEIGGDATIQALLAYATRGATLNPKVQAALAGISALGGSEERLTPEEITAKGAAKAAGNTALSSGLTYVGGKALGMAGDAIKNSSVGRYVGDKVRSAAADAGEAAALKAQKLLRQAIGHVGAETSSGKRTLDVLKEVLESGASTPEQRAAAKAFLDGEDGQKLLRGVYDNTIGRASGELGRISTAREALDTAAKNATPEAVEAATTEALSKPFAPVKRFVTNYGARMIPAAVAGTAGNLMGGGALGTALGAALGFGAGAVMGNPGTAMRNLITNPAVRHATWSGVQSVLTTVPEALGKYGPVLAKEAATHGEKAAQAMHWVLMQTNPEYAKKAIALGAEPAEPAT